MGQVGHGSYEDKKNVGKTKCGNRRKGTLGGLQRAFATVKGLAVSVQGENLKKKAS